MPVTEADWKIRMAEKAKVLAPVARLNESVLRQAAVASELLTTHPAWDTYLQRLQVDLDEAVASVQSWQQKIAGAYTDADLRMVQIQLNIFTDRVATLRHCMAIPKEILTHAHECLDKPGQ